MRKSLLFLLLAAAAGPALAAGDEAENRRAEDRAERAAARAEKQAERAAATEQVRAERSERPQRAERQLEARAVERSDAEPMTVREERRTPVRDRMVVRHSESVNVEPPQQPADSVREWRRAEREDGNFEQRREQVQQQQQSRQRIVRRIDLERSAPIVSRVPREGTQPPLSTHTSRRSTNRHWNGNWRHDRRYDWNNWRKRHRSTFRLGFYFDPFGWGYRPYSIGWRMWPSYYSRSYWLQDPWMYRLPPAYPGTRWIRYYNDAVLVDTWTGEVVDVIYNFFW